VTIGILGGGQLGYMLALALGCLVLGAGIHMVGRAVLGRLRE